MVLWKHFIYFKSTIRHKKIPVNSKLTHFLLGGIMVFIWMVQHANAPVGCFYFIFISLKYNIVAPDYNKNTFVASVIGLRLYLPLYGRSKLRSNRCLHLRLLPPFWKWTADSSFLKSRAYDFEQSWRWLAKLCLSTHPPLAAIFGKRVTCLLSALTTLLNHTARSIHDSGNFRSRSCWQYE